MLTVGLTGGLASGKTFVAEALAALGCEVIHADQLGHEVLAAEGEAFADVVREFGLSILDAGGAIDRKALAALVFENPDRLALLNSLVHPPVWARLERMMHEFADREPDGIVVVEAAILIETGSYRRFDRIVLVVCDEEQQVRRSVKRDGVDEAAVWARLRRQMPVEEKRKFADYVIDTSGEKEQTLLQTRILWEELRRIVK
jgi:dephospho-CoA kinase